MQDNIEIFCKLLYFVLSFCKPPENVNNTCFEWECLEWNSCCDLNWWERVENLYIWDLSSITILNNLKRQIFFTSSIPMFSSSAAECSNLSTIPFKIASFLFCLAQMTKGNPNFSLYLFENNSPKVAQLISYYSYRIVSIIIYNLSYLILVSLSSCFSPSVIVSKPAAFCSAVLSCVRLPSSASLPAKSGWSLSTPSLPIKWETNVQLIGYK